MTEQTPKKTESHLTPAQAADVIGYYDRHDNERSLRNNWKRKRSLGQVAFDTTRRMHSILPEGEPLLTDNEMEAGLAYYRHSVADKTSQKVPEQVSPWPIEPTDSQWETIYHYTDTMDVKEAYTKVMGITVE